MRYQVGDTVTVRSWEDMLEQFRLNYHGDIHINSNIYFAEEMRSFCGQTYKVADLIYDAYLLTDKPDWTNDDYSLDNTEITDVEYWRFVDEMLEEIQHNKAPIKHLKIFQDFNEELL